MKWKGRRKMVDPNEAPKGFFAVKKPKYDPALGNICRQCEWRKTCQDPNTNPIAYGHRCASDAILVFKTMEYHCRDDGESVLFKRKSPDLFDN